MFVFSVALMYMLNCSTPTVLLRNIIRSENCRFSFSHQVGSAELNKMCLHKNVGSIFLNSYRILLYSETPEKQSRVGFSLLLVVFWFV